MSKEWASTQEMLQALPYLAQVCSETLRLKPSLIGAPSRIIQTPGEEYFGAVFPKGVDIDLPIAGSFPSYYFLPFF